jgi:hypothetical protein
LSETWESVQIATLQKMGLITSDTLVRNTTTNPVIAAMPPPANRGLQLLSTAGKFITKSIEITQQSLQEMNILPSPLYMMNIYQHQNDDIPPYTAIGAKSYYFEVDNPATVEITVDGVTTTITNTVKGKFTAYKGNISNPNKKAVTIEFKGSYPYQYRNIAFYAVTFETDADVWDYVSERRYELKTLATDFYKIKEIIYQGGFNENRYEKTSDYHMEGDSTLVLNGFNKGSWKVTYYAYPQTITKTTLGTLELTLDPEVSALLSTYIASELMMEDEPSMAVQFRNEFEVARGELRPTDNSGTVEFVAPEYIGMGW